MYNILSEFIYWLNSNILNILFCSDGITISRKSLFFCTFYVIIKLIFCSKRMKIIQTKKSSSRFEIIACNSAENLLQKDSTSLPFLHLESFGVTCFSQFELIFELYAEHISFF